jgi:thioredoxin-like negative regulator of GroEL
MKRSLTTLATLCLLTTGIAVASEAAIPWQTDINGAMTTADQSSKPIMVDLWAIWCEPCKLMEKTTFRDERILEAAQGFVPLKVDHDANEVFVERYEVEGLPTTLFLDGKGREITRIVSHVETEALWKTMTQVRDGYAAYLEGVGSKKDPSAMRDVAGYLTQVGNPGRAADVLRGAAKAADGESAERIELQLAEALIADEREGAGIKVLKRLSTSATTKSVRGDALVALVRAERQRGKKDKADEALALLRSEFPERVGEVTPDS